MVFLIIQLDFCHSERQLPQLVSTFIAIASFLYKSIANLLREIKIKIKTKIHILCLLVGRPIYVDKIENPSNEQIESLHKKYEESLIDLFNEYNPIYGVKGAKIEIY